MFYVLLILPLTVTMWIGIFLSDFITSALMSWSRFHWNGRFVFIRMIILHLASECILLLGGFIVGPFRGYTILETWHLSYDSIIARTIMSLALLPVARFISWYIQHRVEGVVVFDYKQEFSPFKFGINPTDSVQFNATGWDKIDAGKVNLKKLAEAYSDDFFEEQSVKGKINSIGIARHFSIVKTKKTISYFRCYCHLHFVLNYLKCHELIL